MFGFKNEIFDWLSMTEPGITGFTPIAQLVERYRGTKSAGCVQLFFLKLKEKIPNGWVYFIIIWEYLADV